MANLMIGLVQNGFWTHKQYNMAGIILFSTKAAHVAMLPKCASFKLSNRIKTFAHVLPHPVNTILV
jgi:hypothetical protein